MSHLPIILLPGKQEQQTGSLASVPATSEEIRGEKFPQPPKKYGVKKIPPTEVGNPSSVSVGVKLNERGHQEASNLAGLLLLFLFLFETIEVSDICAASSRHLL
eukprot:Hpha_TRINITY_DN14286_c0_g1::TRINITY_DN14286_c0_g1_i2::g.22088::m.22088